MDQFISSDCNPTMVASQTFNSILDQIQKSSLNFQLQLSPFSANISLKKSLVKDKSGIPIIPTLLTPSSLHSTSLTDFELLATKNIKFESDLATLSDNFEHSVKECRAACAKIELLESQPIIKSEADYLEKNEVIASLKLQIEQLGKENASQRSEIEDLDGSNYRSRKAFEEMNLKYNKSRSDFRKEKALILKQHKVKTKSWRKDLGVERSEKIKLEKKLNENLKDSEKCPALQTSATEKTSTILHPRSLITETQQTLSEEICCTICAQVIVNYIPEYCFDTEMGPACVTCKSVETSIISIPIYPTIPIVSSIGNLSKSVENLGGRKTVGELFEDFLKNFKDCDIDDEAKYERLARNLVDEGGRVLKVSISDIKMHDKQLNKSIDLDYKEAFSQLCSTLEKFIKDKFGKEAPSNVGNFLVLLVP